MPSMFKVKSEQVNSKSKLGKGNETPPSQVTAPINKIEETV